MPSIILAWVLAAIVVELIRGRILERLIMNCKKISDNINK